MRICYVQEGSEDLKKVIGELSELRYRIATDKPITELASKRTDNVLWNSYLQDQKQVSVS